MKGSKLSNSEMSPWELNQFLSLETVPAPSSPSCCILARQEHRLSFLHCRSLLRMTAALTVD